MSQRSKNSSSGKVVVEPLIRQIRGQKVILDADLARIYGVTTKRLNEQVKRNRERFPEDFMFRLTAAETSIFSEEAMRSQFATGSQKRSRSQIATLKRGENIKYLPFAFTEYGAIMAATILNSPQAVQMSVFVVRAFVRMKKMLLSPESLAEELAALKKELRGRLDIHEAAINDILRRIMLILDPPPLPPAPPRREIGFHVR